MKSRTAILTISVATLAFHLAAAGADSELEKLKKAASWSKATLEVKDGKGTQNGRHYNQTLFVIDTEAQQYKLSYKSFPGEEAADNPKELNDGASGYGMTEPNANWYQNGMVDVSAGGCSINRVEGKAKVLQKEGALVAYDLTFDLAGDVVVIRTVALAGREELFLSIHASPGASKFTSTFRGYPCGFKGPFDRWVHLDGSEIGSGDEGGSAASIPLNLEKAPWILLTDHQLNSTGNAAGQLGIVFRKTAVAKASVSLRGNYAITTSFMAKDGGNEMQFILCNFSGMSWQEAIHALAALAKQGESLLDEAFKRLPAPGL